ncbi:inositol 2-dehydrogenase [Spirochaetota bacterium]|nr:inositol 2-dehydrogenase [Spirochaetota bacterium]
MTALASKRVTFAVLGAGRIGRMHANILLTMPHVRLKTILDKYKKTDWLAGNGANVEVTDDLDSILNDNEINAIVIATSSSSHVALIEKILPSGKDIFCEKPVSFSITELNRIKKKVQKAGIKFQIGFNRRHDPNIIELKRLITANQAGKLYMIKIKNRDPKRPPIDFIPKSGGMLFDFNVHDFDMIHFLSQTDIEKVYTVGANLIDPEIGKLGDIDTAIITLQLKNKALATIDCSRETGYGYDQEIEVFGSNGSLKVQNLREHTLLTSHSNHVSIAHPKANFIERYRTAYIIQLERFIDWVSGGTTTSAATSHSHHEIGLHEGLRAVCVAEAASKSLKSGQPEQVLYDIA